MSLIAWYPLSGDTNDYSGNENHLNFVGEQTNIILSETGKTGKAYYKNNRVNMSCLKSQKQVDISGDVSMSCWCYIEDSDNSISGIVTNHNHNDNMGWGINCTGTGSDTRFTVNIGYGDSREYNLKKSKAIEINKWNHFAFTYNFKNNKLKFYVNGMYDKEFSLDKTPLTKPDYISIFAWSNGYLTEPVYRMKGKIQNVKIYDHTQSVKEIKEDYKTKLVELRFENPLEPFTNLVDGMLSKGLTDWLPATSSTNATIELCQPDDISDIPYIKCTRLGNGFDGIRSASNAITCKSSTKYTLSVEVYIPIGLESDLRLYCPEYNNSTLIDYRHYVTIPISTEKGKWYKFEYTWISNQNATRFDGFRLDCSASMPTPLKNIFYSRRMQLVENDHRVIMGEFTSDRISDSSGMGNHAYFNSSKLRPPQWVEESPIGIGSYRFNGDTSLNLPNSFLKQDNLKQSWTVNTWLKINDITKNTQYVLYGLNLGLTCQHTTQRALLYLNNGSNDSYRYSTPSLNQDEWINIIFTFDHETNYIKIFINGEDKTGTGPGPNGLTPAGIANKFEIGTSSYVNLAKLEIYATPFTLDDAISEYKIKASIDKTNSIHVNTIKEKSQYPTIPNDNLIRNGFLEYGDIRNYANSPTLITNDKFCGYDCLEFSGYTNMVVSDLIEVDPNSSYELSGYFKSIGSGGLSKLYYGFKCYDKDKNFLEYHYNNLYSQNTKTTLAKQLNPGDTKIYLNSIDNWASSAAYVHERMIGFFMVRGYPNYIFTNKVTSYSDKNVTEKYLIIPPWTGEAIPIGTKVANCSGGSTYTYSAASNVFVPSEWTKYSSIIKSMQQNGENPTKFRPSTKYIQVAGLINYQQNTTFKTRFTHLCFRNLDTNEVMTIKPGKPHSVSKKSEYMCDEINTIGPTTGLIFWSDLEYDKLKNRTMDDIPMQRFGVNTVTDITPQGKKVIKFNQTLEKDYITANLQDMPYLMSRGYECTSYTLHANIKIDGAQGNESIVLAKLGNHSGLVVNNTAAMFRTVVYDMDNTNGTSHYAAKDITEHYGKWISITGVYEMGCLSLYINGEKCNETLLPYNKQLNAYNSIFHIGGMNHDLYRLRGSITNARIYERALSAKEIKQIHKIFFNENHSINKNGVINCNDIYER